MLMCGLFIMFAFGSMALITVRSTLKLADAEPVVKRYQLECAYMRLTYKDVRDQLWTSSIFTQRKGVFAYERLAETEWHEANICAPAGVWLGHACEPDDRACMLHELDWALVNTR